MAVKFSQSPDLQPLGRTTELKAVAPGDAVEITRSPARDLQHMLAARAAAGLALDPVESIERWSRRRRIALLIASTATLWAVILWGVGLATSLIA